MFRMCCDDHREVLVRAVLHISIDSSCTCVFGGVGTKLDIKLCNDFFVTCIEMTAGPRTPSILSLWSHFYWGYIVMKLLLCIPFLLNFSKAEPHHGTDKKNLCVIYI